MDDSLLLERLLSDLASLFGSPALLLAVRPHGIVSFTVIRNETIAGDLWLSP